ncbi:hypothetical protein C7974DRAFT_141735 [Boeremia exigua]|uniref:uncharacterized protein n=1 Tax=Boeremia exigua TaxID=749465 RepID=UPI001E8E8691|nr:uncharacterized protein C7974DRAFT_141735 [Boeremia exigua]KAH6637464.1 hypothetical protein C7974DRAFT_141735 [Boeremia exigua]
MLTTTVISVLLSLSTASAAFPALAPRACTNHLANPSFESGNVSPWLPIVESAWTTRGVFSDSFTHGGTHHYYAHASSAVSSSFTLSQSGISAPAGHTVDCYAWVAGRRSEGVTMIEVFLDGVSCGTAQLGTGERRWERVGSRVRVGGNATGMGSTIAVVATSKAAGDDGWDLWVDDVGVVGC